MAPNDLESLAMSSTEWRSGCRDSIIQFEADRVSSLKQTPESSVFSLEQRQNSFVLWRKKSCMALKEEANSKSWQMSTNKRHAQESR